MKAFTFESKQERERKRNNSNTLEGEKEEKQAYKRGNFEEISCKISGGVGMEEDVGWRMRLLEENAGVLAELCLIIPHTITL